VSRWLLFSAFLGIALLILLHPLLGALAVVSGCLFVLGLVGQRAVLAPMIISAPARNAARRSIESPPRVSVVIPALNEAENLRKILPRLPGGLHEVILVDGGSADGTVEVARQELPSIRVIRQSGRGKGEAVGLGFRAVTGDAIVMLDADGSADPAEIPLFIDTLCAGADLAKGSRFIDGGGSADITALRRAGNRGLVTTVNTLFGTRYSDLCYGYNAFWTQCLPYFSLDTSGFEVETLINIRAAKAGLMVAEVPSFERGRLSGASHLRPFRDGFRVLRIIVRESWLNPRMWQGRRSRVPAVPAGAESSRSTGP
jgi:glycosyltransferase involved in cell wall biosynthesis